MDIPTFRKGDYARASDLNRLAAAVRAATIQKGIGYTFERSSGGTRLRVLPQEGTGGSGSASASTEINPFEITFGYVVNDILMFRVYGGSYVSIIETGGIVPITGLGALPGTETDNDQDPGLFEFPQIGESIWLEMTLDGMDVTSISVWTGQAGVDGWENYPDPVKVEIIQPEEGSPYQAVTATRVIVAHVTWPDDPRQGKVFTTGTGESAESRKIIQCLKTNLGIQALIMKGIACPIMVPWHAPFQIE